jgi:hypothetical protein
VSRQAIRCGRERTVVAFAVLLMLFVVVSRANAVPGTRTSPYRRGVEGTVDEFAVRVVSLNTDAWPAIEHQSSSNRPPRSGTTYVMVTMRATNLGTTGGIPFVNGVLEGVGRSNARFSPFAEGCGVIPSDVSTMSPVAPHTTATVSECWDMDKPDAASLTLMIYAPYVGPDDVYFALRPAKTRRD